WQSGWRGDDSPGGRSPGGRARRSGPARRAAPDRHAGAEWSSDSRLLFADSALFGVKSALTTGVGSHSMRGRSGRGRVGLFHVGLALVAVAAFVLPAPGPAAAGPPDWDAAAGHFYTPTGGDRWGSS